MRKHARWALWAVLAVIIVVFIFTFGFNRGGSEKTVARVGPYKISAAEYYEAYRRTEDYYRMIYKDKFDEAAKDQLKLKETVMNQLVDKYLFLKEASDMGVKVSDREFNAHLSSIEAFRRNGSFSKQAYEEFLRGNNLNPKTFEQGERQAMVIEKVMRIIKDNGVEGVDEKAAFAQYVKEKGQVKLSVAIFDPADFRDKVSVDEKELEGLYEKERGALRSENRYHLRYILIDGKSAVRDDEAYMELLKSKDMAAFARSKGLELVDLGMLNESELAARFARLKVQDWLRDLGKGEISLPQRDGDRSFIFQTVDREGGKPLDRPEALKQIRARIIGEKAKVAARVKAIDAIAQKGGKAAKDTGFLPRKSVIIPGIGQIPREDVGIFALSAGQTYEKPVEIGGKYYVFSYLDEKLPDKGQWEKDKDAYKRVYAALEGDAYFMALKDDLKKSVKIRIDWNEI
jgi:peptidyl-prolyl cis-trans isomerase D